MLIVLLAYVVFVYLFVCFVVRDLCRSEKNAKVIRRPCDFTSGNLNKTSVREKSRGVCLPVGWVFASYSMIFRLC